MARHASARARHTPPRPAGGPGGAGPASTASRTAALPLVLAAILAALVFANSAGGDFVYDDVQEIRDNPDIRRLSFVFEAFTGRPWTAERGYGFTYRPVSWAAATILHAVGGGSPVAYHVANIVLHSLNTFLFGFLLLKLTGRGAGGSAFLSPAAAGAFLFAVHPAHAEAVAWASGRSDLLSVTFLLGAWIAHEAGAGEPRRSVVVGALFLLALLSKETAAAGLLLLPAWTVGRSLARGEGLRSAAAGVVSVRTWALVLAFAAYAVARFGALGQIGRGVVRGAALLNPLEEAGVGSRVLTALALVPEHLRLLVWPARLSLEYSFDQIPVAVSLLDLRLVWPVAAAAGLTALWMARPAAGRAAASLCALYAAAALPTSNLLTLPAAIFAERYLYLPSAVFCAGVAIVVGRAASKRALLAGALLGAALAACSFRTLDRNLDWRDAETLYRSSISAAPRAARLHYNLGIVLRDQERHAEAERSFRAALEIAPRYADARAELGVALLHLGRAEDASVELRRAAADAPSDPIILNNLGGTYLTMGRPEEAERLLRRAVEADPRNVEAHGNLGKAALERGDLPGARRSFEAMLSLVPGDPAAHVGMGAVEASSGNMPGAIARFRQALALQPDNDEAAFNLAVALLRTSSPGEAVPVLEELSRRRPEDAQAAALLAQARAAAGR